MSEITFTELRQFNSGTNRVDAIIKYNGLIFISINDPDGQVWTYNPITGRFLLNSTFPNGIDNVRAFLVTETAIVNDPANSLFAVTGGTDGKLYVYNNDGTWTERADTTDSSCTSLVIYEGDLYYGTDGNRVFKWDGVQAISLTAAETSGDVTALFVHSGLLFAGATKVADAEIFVFDGSSWSLEDNLTQAGTNQVNEFEEFEGVLYAGTAESGSNDSLWKRDEDVSPIVWVGVAELSGAAEITTLEVFFDKLYIGTRTDDSIRKYDGTTFTTVKEAVTGIADYGSSFADGDSCLYFGSSADSLIVSLFAMCPRCSDELLISIASPFGWNVGDCVLIEEICKVEDGCYCQILNTTDTTTIQIQWNGVDTPHLAISDAITGVESSITAFVNIVGNIWEVDIDVSSLNCETINFIITTRTSVDEGEWLDKTIAGVTLDLETVHVSSLTRIYLASADSVSPILKRSDNQGDSFTDKSQPATGTNGINQLGFKGGTEGNVFGAVEINGFGGSSDGLDSYDDDTNPANGGPCIMSVLNIVHVLIVNQNGGATLSADGGGTWGALVTDPPANAGNYQACFIRSNLIFFVVGNDGKIFSTTDGGATAWAEDHDSANQLKGIWMATNVLGWAVGTNGEILNTSDGSTWVAQASGVATQLNDVFFLTATLGWVVGDSGTILKTEDGGTTWVSQTAPGSANLNSLSAFQSGSNIFVVAVGDSGAVYTLNATTSAGAVDLATSECIRIKNDFDCGLLIKYTNDDNFADFDYNSGLVNQIRIRAHFWQVSNPTEKVIHISSSEEVIPTRQAIKKQIQLETDIMPEYMHEKLAIIFTHAAVEIDGITYVAEENYEYEFGSKFRQTKGRVLLTDKTYTKENIF